MSPPVLPRDVCTSPRNVQNQWFVGCIACNLSADSFPENTRQSHPAVEVWRLILTQGTLGPAFNQEDISPDIVSGKVVWNVDNRT